MQQYSNSEVARLMRQIAEEQEAASLALYGVAIVASHEIITARMEKIGACQERLVELVGPQRATELTIIALGGVESGQPAQDEMPCVPHAAR